MNHPAVNFVGQQIGWFACVLGAANGHPWLGVGVAAALIVLHLQAAPDPARELRLILVASALGVVLESGFQAAGLLTYASPWRAVPWLCPPWIAALWAQFATLLRGGLSRLQGRPLLGGLVGAVGGPLAFRAGEGLGAVQFAPARWATYLALAVVWGAVLPFLSWLAARDAGPSPDSAPVAGSGPAEPGDATAR